MDSPISAMPDAQGDPFAMPKEAIDALILGAVMHHLTDHVFFKDRKGRFVRASNGLLIHFGVQSMDDLIGKTDFDFFDDAHARPAWEDEQRVIATGETMPPKIEREVWPNRPDTWASTIKLPWRNTDGAIIGIFGISRNVTAEHELRLELERKTFQLENSNRELEQFAFIASHDLQEPLRMITGFVQLFQRRYGAHLDDRACGYLGHVVDGATRMSQLIDGLLQYSRVKSNAPQPQPVDCSLVLADVVRNLQVSIKEADAQLEICGQLPVVLGVRSQIAQVLQNLFSNAIKFRRKDVSPVITVSCERSGDTHEISVADNGIGIDLRYADRIFGMFQRLHTRREYEGNGIGLAMAKRIMIQHGGDIRVESEPGAGSCFILTFPVPEDGSHE